MFDTALLESGKHRTLGGRKISLSVAIGAHLLVVGALVGASAWYVGEPPEPADTVIFTTFRGGPTPGGPGPIRPRVRGPRTGGRSETPRVSLPQVVVIPDDATPPGDSTESEPMGTGAGLEPGTGPEGPGGPGTAIDTGTGDGDREILIPGVNGVRPPEALLRVDPAYPDAARRARIEGTVILEAVITDAGEVDQVRIVASVNPMLDAAAAAAVRQWRYKPASRNGRAVAVYLTVQIRFSLKT